MVLFICQGLIYLMIRAAEAQFCSPKYTRFSESHTVCLPPNDKCDFLAWGIDPKHRKKLLDMHNSIRSSVAMGKEKTTPGGLPTAANMMQMVWDRELSAIAQKWANNCEYKHDCQECRAVERFETGQNIAYLEHHCPNVEDCLKGGVDVIKPDWDRVMEGFYMESRAYDRSLVANHKNIEGKIYYHFTQMTWAATWRLGCGYTVFEKSPGTFRQFYVCNYGPSGNIEGQNVYDEGKPCSKCPANSCCGPNCPEKFDGLCKMMNPKEAVVPKRDYTSFLMFCTFDHPKQCPAVAEGKPRWSIRKSYLGFQGTVKIKSGQKTTVYFQKPIKVKSSHWCWAITYRKSATTARRKDRSQFWMELKPENGGFMPIRSNLQMSGTKFSNFTIDFHVPTSSYFQLTFMAPKGSYEHVLDINNIRAWDGPCQQKH